MQQTPGHSALSRAFGLILSPAQVTPDFPFEGRVQWLRNMHLSEEVQLDCYKEFVVHVPEQQQYQW